MDREKEEFLQHAGNRIKRRNNFSSARRQQGREEAELLHERIDNMIERRRKFFINIRPNNKIQRRGDLFNMHATG